MKAGTRAVLQGHTQLRGVNLLIKTKCPGSTAFLPADICHAHVIPVGEKKKNPKAPFLPFYCGEKPEAVESLALQKYK